MTESRKTLLFTRRSNSVFIYCFRKYYKYSDFQNKEKSIKIWNTGFDNQPINQTRRRHFSSTKTLRGGRAERDVLSRPGFTSRCSSRFFFLLVNRGDVGEEGSGAARSGGHVPRVGTCCRSITRSTPLFHQLARGYFRDRHARSSSLYFTAISETPSEFLLFFLSLIKKTAENTEKKQRLFSCNLRNVAGCSATLILSF